jgi:hypothetical protein
MKWLQEELKEPNFVERRICQLIEFQQIRELLVEKYKIEKEKVKDTVDGDKKPLQQRGSFPIPQVPIRLTNVWYGRPDGIMDPLPSRG